MTILGYIAFSLRRSTYVGWLGSGWPEWVAVDNNPVEFNQDINRLQSFVSFTLLFANLVPGFWIDFCRKKWQNRSDTYGEFVGLGSSYIICTICMVVASILQAQQSELAANSAVIVHNVGRCFGVLWNPVYFYLFPAHLYGFVFGSIALIAQPFGLLNIFMLSYNTKNDDYAVMNYLLAGIISLLVVVSFACYRRYKTNQKNSVNNNTVYENCTSL